MTPSPEPHLPILPPSPHTKRMFVLRIDRGKPHRNRNAKPAGSVPRKGRRK